MRPACRRPCGGTSKGTHEHPGRFWARKSAGASVFTAGDVNGDGFSDLFVGAPQHRQQRGKVYLYLGSSNGLSRKPAWTAEGEADADAFGEYAAAAGDVNGDGTVDFLVGAPGHAERRGKVYLFYGRQGGLPELLPLP